MQYLLDLNTGKRSEKLTQAEIEDLVSETSSYRTSDAKAKANMYYANALKRGHIGPNKLLVTAIDQCKEPGDLALVALAIRNGANKNLYSNVPGMGAPHLLALAVYCLRKKKVNFRLVDLLLALLMRMGSNLDIPVFDQRKVSQMPSFDVEMVNAVGQKVSAGFKPVSLEAGPKIVTVRQWLQSQGVPYTAIDFSNSIMLGTMADDPTRAFVKMDRVGPLASIPKETELPELCPPFTTVLLSRALTVAKQAPIHQEAAVRQVVKGEFEGLRRCIETGCSGLYGHLVDSDLTVSYFTINRLVLYLRDALARGDVLFGEELQIMLIHSISRGVRLDKEQMAIVTLASESVAQLVLAEYRQPQWKKVCTLTSGESSEELRNFAFSLNLDPRLPKTELCSKISGMTRPDPEALKKAVVLRQRASAAVTRSSIQDFVGDGASSEAGPVCANKTALQEDPFSYNDAQMSAYTDPRGTLWCFTSDTFEELVRKKVNPHNGARLPDIFLVRIEAQLQVLRMLRVAPSSAVSIDQAIDRLEKPDEVTDDESGFIVSTIIKTALTAGISESRLRSLNFEEMNLALRTLNNDQFYLELLSTRHCFVTFCRAAHYAFLRDQGSSRPFFRAIDQINSRKARRV